MTDPGWERVYSLNTSDDKETATVYERTPWHTARIWAIPGMVLLVVANTSIQNILIDAPIYFLACLLINRLFVGIYRKISRPSDFEWVATIPLVLFLAAGALGVFGV